MCVQGMPAEPSADITYRLLVTDEEGGLLIGKHGETIACIRRKTSASINVPNKDKEAKDRVVSIGGFYSASGHSDAVAALVHCCRVLVESYRPQIDLRLVIPSYQVAILPILTF